MRTPPVLEDLSRRQRRLFLLRALVRPMLTATGLVVAYYLLPLDQSFSGWTAVGLLLGLLAVVVLVAWQTRAIVRSPHPRLKAVEALTSTFPLFVLLFSVTYFLMERSNPGAFSEPMSRTDALYFTLTVFTTVGFGDITAVTEPGRGIVIVQMVADLFLLGIAAHVILGAVRANLDRRGIPIGGSVSGSPPPAEGDGDRPERPGPGQGPE